MYVHKFETVTLHRLSKRTEKLFRCCSEFNLIIIIEQKIKFELHKE